MTNIKAEVERLTSAGNSCMQNDDVKNKTHHSLKSIPRFDYKTNIRPPNHKGVKSAKLLKKFELKWKTLFAKPLNKWTPHL